MQQSINGNSLADARWMTVNLQPDEPGAMDRSRTLLTDPARGYDHVPPSQRLGDAQAREAQSRASAQPPSPATDQKGRKYCEAVLDGRRATELRMPGTDGSSMSYRYRVRFNQRSNGLRATNIGQLHSQSCRAHAAWACKVQLTRRACL